jgi:predicted amidophosphoribosyltransferase
MNDRCFVEQIATNDILLRVTNVCSACYASLEEGARIYYDMHSYRYLCESCKEKLSEHMNEECEIEKNEAGLF